MTTTLEALIDNMKKDLKDMSTKQHFYYWVGPTIVIGTFMYFYFSEIPVLEEFVAPQANREWGVLENLQLVVIIGIASITAYAFFYLQNSIQKVGAALICLFSLFVFFEEIDYGAHFMQLEYGTRESLIYKYTGVTNLHNLGDNAALWKRPVYPLMALLFVIGPFLEPLVKNKYLKFLIPKAPIMIIALLALVTDLAPRIIIGFNIRENKGLGNNTGEFSELVIYYVFLLYLIQLIFEKQFPPKKSSFT